MALPSVQKVRLDAMRAEAVATPPVQAVIKAPASAVVSMAPNVEKKITTEVPLDETAFSVAPPVKEVAAPIEESEVDFQERSKEYYHKWKTVAGMFEKAKSDLEEQKVIVKQLQEDI